jgi:hypothetical protein
MSQVLLQFEALLTQSDLFMLQSFVALSTAATACTLQYVCSATMFTVRQKLYSLAAGSVLLCLLIFKTAGKNAKAGRQQLFDE